jgi:hypothetical protein
MIPVGKLEGGGSCDASSGERVHICVLERRWFSISDTGSSGDWISQSLGMRKCAQVYTKPLVGNNKTNKYFRGNEHIQPAAASG